LIVALILIEFGIRIEEGYTTSLEGHLPRL